MRTKLLAATIASMLSLGAAHAQLGYFAFIDYTHKTLYITEMTDLQTEKGRWENVNYVEGFIQQLGWTEEQSKKYHFSHDFEFVGNIDEFKKIAYNKRERRIEIEKNNGFTIKPIPVPLPKPLKYKTSKGSAQ